VKVFVCLATALAVVLASYGHSHAEHAAIGPDMLAAMKSGKQLKVSFQNLAKETITIPMPLADFAAAYDKIK
jgi:hypothetical protein